MGLLTDLIGITGGAATQTGQETLTNKTLVAPVFEGTADMNGNLDVDGNLNFTGTARRITGDFSNAPVGNRLMFQTSVANGATGVYAIPNGTAQIAAFTAAGSSDPANAPVFSLTQYATESRLVAGAAGTGAFTPVTFYAGGAERLRISVDGNFGFGLAGATPDVRFVVSGPNAGLAAGSTQEILRIGDGRGAAASDGLRFYAVRDTAASSFGDWGTQTLRLERNIDSVAPQSGIDFSPSALKLRTGGVERLRIEWDGNTAFRAGVQEAVVAANTGAAYSINLALGTIFDLTLTANCAYTFPAPTAGKQFTLLQRQDGAGSRTVTWPTNVRWDDGGTAPTPTATAGRTDVFTFLADGNYWIGFKGPKNYNRS